ncbi:hypothetical protein NN561_006003 [Cricetulus griseus]
MGLRVEAKCKSSTSCSRVPLSPSRRPGPQSRPTPRGTWCSSAPGGGHPTLGAGGCLPDRAPPPLASRLLRFLFALTSRSFDPFLRSFLPLTLHPTGVFGDLDHCWYRSLLTLLAITPRESPASIPAPRTLHMESYYPIAG